MRLDIRDHIGLARGIDVDAAAGTLVDTALGAHHQLNSSACRVAALLGSTPRGTPFGELIDALRGSDDAVDSKVIADLVHLLEELDSQALLHVRRPWRITWRPALLLNDLFRLVTGGNNTRPARRFPGTVPGVTVALASMLWVPLLLGAVVMDLLHTGMRIALPDAEASVAHYASLVGLLGLVLLVLMWLHECAHLIALRGRGHATFIACRGARIAVVHRPLDQPWSLVEVAVSGPATAFVAGLALWPLSALAWPPADAFVAAPAIGACHLLSLLPVAADGRMLQRALHSRSRSSSGAGAAT